MDQSLYIHIEIHMSIDQSEISRRLSKELGLLNKQTLMLLCWCGKRIFYQKCSARELWSARKCQIIVFVHCSSCYNACLVNFGKLIKFSEFFVFHTCILSRNSSFPFWHQVPEQGCSKQTINGIIARSMTRRV